MVVCERRPGLAYTCPLPILDTPAGKPPHGAATLEHHLARSREVPERPGEAPAATVDSGW